LILHKKGDCMCEVIQASNKHVSKDIECVAKQ
jgi:hypothetical protein